MGSIPLHKYAAMAIGASSLGDNSVEIKTANGPSNAPLIAIDADSIGVNLNKAAITNTHKIPSWPAIPRGTIFGLDNKDLKSIMAPIPIKIRRGNK